MIKKIIVSAFVLSVLTAVSYAGVIATNGDVPLTMDSDLGTAEDLATYVLDGFIANSNGAFVVGSDNPYNHLIMKNGSVMTNTVDNWIYMTVGRNAGASNCTATITGEGTELVLAQTAGAQAIYIGSAGANSTLEILDGAHLVATNSMYMRTSGGNNLIIDDATVDLFGRFFPAITGSSNNYVSVRNGGQFNMPTSQRVDFNESATNFWLEVRDFGSVLNWYYSVMYGGLSNLVVVADEGLMKSRYDANWINYPRANDDTCFWGFAGGYFAQGGQSCVLDWNKYIRLWDGEKWVEPATLAEAEALGWSKIYYSDDAAGEAAALAATGYSGLAGYEVYTGGEPMYPPPPQGTVLIIQ